MARDIASNVISYIGHAGINRLASLVKGSGYKLSGGAHKKKRVIPRKHIRKNKLVDVRSFEAATLKLIRIIF